MLAGDHRQLPPIVAHDWEEDRPPVELYQPFTSAFEAVRNLSENDEIGEHSIDLSALRFTFRLPPTIRALIARLYRAEDDLYIQVIKDYIDNTRIPATDDHGREPLITSAQGRLTAIPIRRTIYRWTRPCMVAECPHDKDPMDCEWMVNDREASRCPSSRSPHTVRRGAITRDLREGVPEQIVSDRMNVHHKTLDQHYNRRTEREKMELRREFLDNEE